jgi:hypothetical protein
MQRYFVIKADDFLKGGVSNRFIEFVRDVNGMGIPVSLGTVGQGIEKQKNSRIAGIIGKNEIFAHGYYHLVNFKGVSEYCGTSYQFQYDSIISTITIAWARLGKHISTFGAPGNCVDSTTARVLANIAEIKTIFFCPVVHDRNVLRRNFEFEYRHRFRLKPIQRFWYVTNVAAARLGAMSLDNCGLEELASRYRRSTENLLVGQLHPDWWSRSQLRQLYRFLEHLLKDGIRFITADEVSGKSELESRGGIQV